MSKLKVFLTGGEGFIGRHIQEQLGESYDFLAPSHNELDLSHDQNVYAFIKQHRPDIVLHAANIGGNRKQKNLTGVTYQNLRMFFNIIRGQQFFGRLIVLGSGAEYDKRQSLVEVSEDDYKHSVPVDEYGFAKYVMASFAEEVDYITHLRIFGVYGSGEDYETRFISNTICKALLNLSITIKQNVYFDYVYVKDLARQIDFFLKAAPKYKFYNLGRGQKIDLKSIADKVITLTGKNLSVNIAVVGLNKEYSCSIKRFLAENPGFVFTDFDESLKELAAYYKTVLPNINQSVFLVDV